MLNIADAKDILVIIEDTEIRSIQLSPSKESVDSHKQGVIIDTEQSKNDLDSKGESLIDRKNLNNIEDFDVYESLIQGESLYKQPFLIDTHKNHDELTFDISFDKPISLFCLGMEIYYDAKADNLKPLVKGNPSEQKIEEKKTNDGTDISQTQFDMASEEKNYDNSKGEQANLELENENKCIPLIVYTHEGCSFNATSQLSKLVSDDKRSFGANYADSHYIFTHQFGKKFIIDQYIVMSENNSQIGAFPMGAGILFVGDTLASLKNTEPFHSFTLKQYLEWRDKRMYDPRPLEAYEPVGYFDMGSSIKIVDRISSKRPCKYVKLVPTAFKKTQNNNFPQERFSSYPIEFKFFGVIGEELDSKLENDENSENITLSNTVKELCDTATSFKIQMNKEGSWETIHTEDTILVQELQSCGINFNISTYNMDKLVSWISSNKMTGVYKNKITNSKLQINMIQKLRVVISHSKDNVWRPSGLKLSPKALINIEKNSKGAFSKIPVKHLRS